MFAGVSLGLVSALTACGQSANQSSTSSPASSSPATAQAPDSSVTGPSKDALTGFGATVSAWNTHHTADTRYAAGSVYDPDPSLPSHGGAPADYIQVTPQDGRITDYIINTPGLPIGAAIARARQELPPDARERWGTKRDTCYQVELTSSTLGHALASPNIGDPQRDVFVEFFTVGSPIYRSTDIDRILVGLGSYPTAASVPTC